MDELGLACRCEITTDPAPTTPDFPGVLEPPSGSETSTDSDELRRANPDGHIFMQRRPKWAARPKHKQLAKGTSTHGLSHASAKEIGSIASALFPKYPRSCGELTSPLPAGCIRPGVIKTAMWQEVQRPTPEATKHQLPSDLRHPSHVLANCRAVLRALYVILPLGRIVSHSRDEKALDMDVFASTFAVGLAHRLTKEQHGQECNATAMTYALYAWLGRMSTSGGNGKTMKLGRGSKCCRFRKWDGFHLEDENELERLVVIAVDRCQFIDPV